MELTSNDNCGICAQENSSEELIPVALSAVNITKFKICKECLAKSNPKDDYAEVRNVVRGLIKAR